MPRTVQAKLNNGEIVDVNVPDGMTEDQAGAMFMQKYNANPSAYESPEHQLQATPQVQATPSEGLMNPNHPGPLEIAKDAALSAISGLPSGFTNTIATIPKGYLGITAALEHLFGTEPGPTWHKINKAVNGATDEMLEQTGGDYVPKTALGDFSKSVGEGVGGAATMGGVGAGNLALGAASGAASHLTQKAYSDNEGNGGEVPAYAAAALPSLAASLLSAARSPGSVYKSTRRALDNTEAGDMSDARWLQATADANKVGVMPWQLFQPGTEVHELGRRVASMPTSEGVQQNLRSQVGSVVRDTQTGEVIPSHAAADTLELFPRSPTPDTYALTEALRRTAALRGANVTGESVSRAGSHEAGQVALGMGIMPEAVKKIAEPILGGLELRRGGMISNILQGPKNEAADRLFSQTSLDDFIKMANTKPRNEAIRQMLQGAYGIPASQGLVSSGDEN